MVYSKKFDNGLRLVIENMEGCVSVSCGVLVNTGSANESAENNGISHFIEHTMFKGTPSRTAFDISDQIDRIGGQINAYTSKERTCYYTKSTAEHLNDTLEILSDIFFNSEFKSEELKKEKGVIIEEINMCEDSPEDLCLDLLMESFYGRTGLGQTILGSIKNVKSFTKEDVKAYMDKYYTADNVIISIAGKVDIESAERTVEKLFANNFDNKKSCVKAKTDIQCKTNLYRTKKIEQTHIALSMPALSVIDEDGDTLNIANMVFGGGMSSRLFQSVREKLGLAYSVYSSYSPYKDCGNLEVYAGVNTNSREKALRAIIDELESFRKNGITKEEFIRGKEQIKSAFIMSRESTVSQMFLIARYLICFNEEFDYEKKIDKFDRIKIDDVNRVISKIFDYKKASSATVGSKKTPLKF